jgi:hypothetical protein
MKFKAAPNYYVRLANKFVQRSTGLKGLHFDKNGEYTTTNEIMIKVLSQHFEVVEDVVELKTEPSHVCKKCDFTTDNQGLLLSHYRSEHPKKEESA